MACFLARFRWTISVWLSRCRTTARYVIAVPFTYRNWWAVPLPKLGKSVVLELRDGTKYLVRAGTTDLAAVNEAAILNPYLRCPQIVLPEDATVIDIGAYIGDFTMQVARACPRGRIFAVEPISAHVQMIEAQIALNHLSHVQTVRAAVGATCEMTRITMAGTTSRVSEREDSAEVVEMFTLERLMQDHSIDTLDLLKLDCEGAEWDILPAAERVLPRVRQICMEFHCERGWTAEKLADWLRSRGFMVSHTGGAWNGLLWATRSTSRRQP
jgi:FkbM family methyltransferase